MEPVNIQDISLSHFKIPLVQPLLINGREFSHRNGLILAVKDFAENTGYGEISPLPGLFQESTKDCHQAMILNINSGGQCNRDNIIHGYKITPGLPSAAAFAWDMARLNLLAVANNIPLHQVINPNANDSIAVNGLLMRGELNPLKQIKQLLDDGYKTIKLKTGAQTVCVDLDRVNRITTEFGNKLVLRLDANRAWSIDDALQFLNNLKHPQYIEYIEEPLSNTELLPTLADQSPVPIALDESLRELDDVSCIPDWAGALVLKPALMGYVSRTLAFIARASVLNIKTIITSSFESGLGLSAYASLSAAALPAETAVGLDTWRWLKQDISRPAFNIRNGRVDLHDLKTTVDESQLHHLDQL